MAGGAFRVALTPHLKSPNAVLEAAKVDKDKGAMIAIPMPAHVTRPLLGLGKGLETPQDAAHMHATLAFIPDKTEFDSSKRGVLEWAVERVAREFLPARANVSGIGVFSNMNEELGGYPYVATINAPGLDTMRAKMFEAIHRIGTISSNFVFIPHITLGYDSGKASIPRPADIPKIEWIMDSVAVYWDWNEPSKVFTFQKKAA